jgi:hypothetical protein
MTLTKRLFVLNFAGACLIIWAWWAGFIGMITAADPFHITSAIAAFFVSGTAYAFWRARQLASASTLKEARIAWIKNVALVDVIESLAMLGLIGTALGLLHAFGGVNKDSLGSPEGIKDAAVHVLTGVKLLAGATLAGIGLALWSVWNNRMIETATALRIEELS